MNFKYAIFDLDGTLLESMKVWRDCDIEEIQVFLGSPLTKQQISEYEVLPFIEMVKKAQAQTGREFDVKGAVSRIYSRLKKYYCDGTITLKPYAKEYLEFLKLKGVKLAVATATDKEICFPCLKRYGIFDYFDCLFTTSETKSKNHPDIFNACIDKLGCTKAETMVFEDALYSIKTLYDNGFRSTAVYDDRQRESDRVIIKQYAEKFVYSLDELMKDDK